MSENNGFSARKIKEILEKTLRDSYIDLDLITVKIKGSFVILRGAVHSREERNAIVQTIQEILGIDVVDELMVMNTSPDGGEEYGRSYERNEDLMDEDNEFIGTDDVFRAVEDGLPYIPPLSAGFEESYGERKRRMPHRRD